MSYRTQFSDYDDVLPEIDGWADDSYRNDVCPKLEWSGSIGTSGPEFTVLIWCDYKDPAKREREGGTQYAVTINGQDVYESDDFAKVRIFIEGVEALWRVVG